MIKVKNVKPYTLPDGRETFVCEGKLLLIKSYKWQPLILSSSKSVGLFLSTGKTFDERLNYMAPIIISENEEINKNDKVLFHGIILECLTKWNGNYTFSEHPILNTFSNHHINYFDKIISNPEHFSPSQLQMIVNGELKDGDKILLECIFYTIGNNSDESGYYINIDSNNHVVILPNKSEIEVAVVGAGKPEIIKRTYTRDEHLFIYLEGVRAGHDDSTSGESLSRSMMKQRTWFDKNIK